MATISLSSGARCFIPLTVDEREQVLLWELIMLNRESFDIASKAISWVLSVELSFIIAASKSFMVCD